MPRVPSFRLFLAFLGLAAGLSAQTCTFTLTATPTSFPLAGGSGTLQIVASSSTCVRNVSSSASWITIVFGQTGTGNGSAGFTVDANNSAPTRTGTITVGSQSVTINQAGPPCNFAVNPPSVTVSAQAQNGSFALTGLAGCTWTASSNASFVQVNSPTSGTGPATIAYTVQANTAASARSGTISVAGLTFTVNQSGVCAYTLSPQSGSYPSSGGSGSFTVNSGAGCAWTAAAGATWIHILSGASGSGSGQVTFTLDANSGDARSSAITVAGQTFTIAQAAFACTIALTPGSASIASGGGSITFSVSAPAGCSWSAATTTPWMTVVSGGSGSGAGVVGISAAPNSGDLRTGTVTVGGQVFNVTQAGPQIQISLSSFANAANYVGGAVAPGLIIVVAVPGIGPAGTVLTQLTSDNLSVTTELGGVRVLFDGIPSAMIYAANGQFGAVVPYAVAGNATTQMQVEFQGVRSNSLTVPVVHSSPGLLSHDSSGSGPGVILDPAGNLNSATNPAAKGSSVVIYATGEGQTSPAGVDGKLADAPYPKPLLPVTVSIDGIDAEAAYAGSAPGLVSGLLQVNVTIPSGARSGAVPVLLKIGSFQSQIGVTVAVQ